MSNPFDKRTRFPVLMELLTGEMGDARASALADLQAAMRGRKTMRADARQGRHDPAFGAGGRPVITFSLPFPPGVNNLFPSVMTSAGPKRVKSKAYRAWIAEAGWMVPPAAKGRAMGHFRAALVFDRQKRATDIDGRVKAVLDLLKTTGVIKDDSLAEGLTLDWASPFDAPAYPINPMVRVTIVPLEAA